MDNRTITLEFIVATPTKQKSEEIKLQNGVTLKEALPFFQLYHEAVNIYPQHEIGVFNQIVDEDYRLHDGDRIELYRPLMIDPKEARKIRAERQREKERKTKS